ncbi:mucin-5AC-like [Branchiostoma floridae]|uniref:Mucin-5AC-like n=2 Tax=Branchiostoma floridae TaxID=7739 RepID=A0A9J7MTJ9_BRAFL|nr:mucin-5AC-like [Branchiostoma floridae]
MGNAEDKEETEVGTMSVTQSEGQKDAPPNLDPETVCSNGSRTDEPSTVPGTKTEVPLPNACELLPNTCEAMETDELDPSEGPPELQPYDIYQGPDFSETFDSDAFDSIGLNSFVDEFENDGRDTPELHLYDTATDEDFEGSNFSFSASGDGLMFNQDEITNELTNEGQSVFSGIRSETEVQDSECPILIEDKKLDKKGSASQEEDATEEDRTEDSLTEREDNQDEDVDKSSSKEDNSLGGKNELLEEQKQEISEKEEERSKRDATLDTFSAILASRSLTHKVLADIAAEWITHELKEVDQKSMPEVFQVPTCQSTWQLLSGERIYTRERQKKMMCRRSKRKRTGVSYKDSDPLYNCPNSKYVKTKRDKRFTANPWKKTVPAVDDDGKLSCRMCKFVCDTYTAFHQHLLDHHTWKKCTKCSFLTQSQKKMNAHIKIMHTPRDQWPEVKMLQRCQLCGLDTGSPGNLQEHILYSHKCYICGFITKQKGDLEKHMDTLHKGSPKLKPLQANSAPGNAPGHTPGLPSVFAQGNPSVQKAFPVANNIIPRPSWPQVQHRPNILTQTMSFPRVSAPPTQLAPRMQPVNTVLGHPGNPVTVGVSPGVITVPQQVTGTTVVRLQNNATHAETYVRCTFCFYLFSTLTAAHAHMANVHWRQISALAQAGQKIILPKVILYTNSPPQHKVQGRPKTPINKNTVKHLLNKDDNTHTSGEVVASTSIPSHQNVQKGTTTVVNPSGQVPVPTLGTPATPVSNVAVRHPVPAPQAIPGIARPPVVGTVNAVPAVSQGFQTVQASPSSIGIARAPIVRQQFQPNLATTLPGGNLTSVAPGPAGAPVAPGPAGAPVAPGTSVGPQQQIMVLKKEGEKFVWVTQPVQNVASLLPNQNKGLTSAVPAPNQTVTVQSTSNIVTQQVLTASNVCAKEESQLSSNSNQAVQDAKSSERVPRHTVVTTQATPTVITQSANTSSATTTAQNIVATPASTIKVVSMATSTTTTNANVASVSQQKPCPLSTIVSKSTPLSGVVSINVPTVAVTPSQQVGVTPMGQLALVSQPKTTQPPPKTVYFVNKVPQGSTLPGPLQQLVTLQGAQVVQRVASPVVNVRGIQPGVVGSGNQSTANAAQQTILVMADGQRIMLPKNQRLITVPAQTTPKPNSLLQNISLAPAVEVSNSQFVMRNINTHRSPGYAVRLPVKAQLQNVVPGQTLVTNSTGGLLVPTQNVRADDSRPGRPVVLPLAPKPEPKSDNASVANQADKSEPTSTPVINTETASTSKATPHIRDKNKKAKVKHTTGKHKNNLLKKKQKRVKTEEAESAETILLRSFHSAPYLTSRELQQLKFKTYRSASDIRYWFHTMQRKCMKSFEQREPRVVLSRCDAKKPKVE